MKVLVYQIGQLGDTIVSIPALRAVRDYFGPDSRISVLHDAIRGLVTADTVLADSGLADEFISYTPQKTFGGKLGTMAQLWRRLRRDRFDAVVNLLPSDRPARALLRDRFFFYACGIPRLVGFRPFSEATIRPRYTSGRPARLPSEAIFRLRRLFAEGIGIPSRDLLALPLLSLGREREAKVDRWLECRRWHPMRPLVAVCPGSKKVGNAWPADRFLEIAHRLLRLDRCEIVILGGPMERRLADFLVDRLGGAAIHAAGCFSVMESAALLSRCSLLVGLDTGTTHLAAAMGVPCVVIQSASSFPGQWDPLGENHSVIRSDVPCEGCLLQKCPVAGHPCMLQITVEQVWQAVETAIFANPNEHYARHSHV